MIVFKHTGNFSKTHKFLDKAKKGGNIAILDKYGQAGVAALASATPIDSGLTASSWYYTIERQNGSVSIVFSNSNVVDGWCNVAIILQYGHGTGTGGWVEGRDYINPAIQPIFDKLANDAWEEVTSL
jgi:hypothetical protein